MTPVYPDLLKTVKTAVAEHRCPKHWFGIKFSPHFTLYCHRCDVELVISPDVKWAIDTHYSLIPYDISNPTIRRISVRAK